MIDVFPVPTSPMTRILNRYSRWDSLPLGPAWKLFSAFTFLKYHNRPWIGHPKSCSQAGSESASCFATSSPVQSHLKRLYCDNGDNQLSISDVAAYRCNNLRYPPPTHLCRWASCISKIRAIDRAAIPYTVTTLVCLCKILHLSSIPSSMTWTAMSAESSRRVFWLERS